ncbi:hypothetical protein [Erwinia aphidicola]|uniref:hypothetical protein n=1 Tax=Erwinia aphidicola TaxID=68334 RepID=UPI00300C9F32
MIRFNNYQELDAEASDLIQQLFFTADSETSAFPSFIIRWMGFNGWMECVTGAETDADMISQLADEQRLSDAYDSIIQSDAAFRHHVNQFAVMLPVLNVRDVKKKLGRDAFWRYSRDELMAEVILHNVKHRPVDWVNGETPTWKQVILTIYAVRCNLFHGSKSPTNYRDHQLVVSCDNIIKIFIIRSECLGWWDE